MSNADWFHILLLSGLLYNFILQRNCHVWVEISVLTMELKFFGSFHFIDWKLLNEILWEEELLLKFASFAFWFFCFCEFRNVNFRYMGHLAHKQTTIQSLCVVSAFITLGAKNSEQQFSKNVRIFRIVRQNNVPQ